MNFLLDTDICSAHMRRPTSLAHRFIQHTGQIAISSVTLAELYAGAYKHSQVNRLLALIDELRDEVAVVEGATVRITKKGWLLAAAREKSLPLRKIASVEVKKPGLASGFIQFSIAGGAVRDSSLKLTGGAFDAAGDETSLLFTSDECYQIALKIKDYIDRFTSPPSLPATVTVSAADETERSVGPGDSYGRRIPGKEATSTWPMNQIETSRSRYGAETRTQN